MNRPVKYDDPVLYQPMTEEDGEAGRFVVELRKRIGALPSTAPEETRPIAKGRATRITICGCEIKLGDWVRVHYTAGRQGWVEGEIVELWGGPLQARVSSGWCFHDQDEILELRAAPNEPPKERSATKMERLVSDALECEGDHHTRWYLEQLADLLGVPVNERKGIAP